MSREISAEESDAAIAGYLEASDGPSTLAAMKRLGKLGVGISHIWDATESGWARLRNEAFTAMSELPGPAHEHLPFLRAGLTDENPYVVVSATQAAASLGAMELASDVRPRLGDPNRHVRRAAASALGRLGGADDVPDLAICARDGDHAVAGRALRSLIQIGRRETIDESVGIDLITQLLTGPAPQFPREMQLRSSAVDLAGELPPSTRVVALVRGILDEGGAGSGRAAVVLGKFGEESSRLAIEGLLLSGTQATHRAELIQGLVKLGVDPSLPVLTALVDGTLDNKGVNAIARAVVHSRDPQALEIVLRLAGSSDIAVRILLLRLLPDHHPLALEVTRVGLNDFAQPVRVAAVSVAKNHAVLIHVLRSMRDNEHDEVVLEALAELPDLDPPTDEVLQRQPAAMLLWFGDSPSDRAMELVRAHAVAEAFSSGADIDSSVASALRDLAAAADEVAGQLRMHNASTRNARGLEI